MEGTKAGKLHLLFTKEYRIRANYYRDTMQCIVYNVMQCIVYNVMQCIVYNVYNVPKIHNILQLVCSNVHLFKPASNLVKYGCTFSLQSAWDPVSGR